MPKFIVDLELDGYTNDQERLDACLEFIYEQLNFSASSVDISIIPDDAVVLTQEEFAQYTRK